MRIGVSPNGGKWQLTRDGLVVGLHDDRDAAVAAAQALAAEADEAEVVVVEPTGDAAAHVAVDHGRAHAVGDDAGSAQVASTADREPTAPTGAGEETAVEQQQR